MNLNEQLYAKTQHIVNRIKKTNKHRLHLMNIMRSLEKDISPEFLRNLKEKVEINDKGNKIFFSHIYFLPDGRNIEIECVVYINKKTYSLFPKGKNGANFGFIHGKIETHELWKHIFIALSEANDKCLSMLSAKKKLLIKRK